VKSTKYLANPPRLEGLLIFDNQGRIVPKSQTKPSEFVPDSVPETWPAGREWPELNYPEVYPQISKRRDVPPTQERMEQIFRFIVG
jgi:hypothetical protein